MADEIIQPMSTDELNALRRKIVAEPDWEPEVDVLSAAVQSICAARPLPEEKPPKKSTPKTPPKRVNLDDLL